MKAITHMGKLTNTTLQKRNALVDFINMMEIIYGYSLDHEKGGLYERTLERVSKITGVTAELSREIDKIFFKNLYVDRPERKSIENYIKSTNNLIFLVGLVGIGKTTLLKKIENNLKEEDINVIYINFKSKTYSLKGKLPDETDKELRNLLFKTLYDQLLPKDSVTELIYYDILYDKSYQKIKYELDRKKGYKIESIEELKNAYSIEDINSYIKGIYSDNILDSIINLLLNHKIKFVIFFDNLDRLAYTKQISVAILARELTEKYGMPSLVSIRNTNIRQVVKEMRDRTGEGDNLGSIFYFETITPIFNKGEQYFQLQPIDQPDIKDMIMRRYNVLKNAEFFGSLQSYKDAFLKKNNLTSEEFDGQFWLVLDRITFNFIEIGVYQYSNYNLREMFMQYIGFFMTLLLNPENDYLWEKLILSTGAVDQTKLKNYMLKWQIANGKIIPEEPKNFVNIYQPIPDTINMLDNYILIYLYNKLQENKNRNILLMDLFKDFARLNVNRELICERLLALSEPRSEKHLGLIWLDTQDQDDETFEDNTIVVLNPASEYFLLNLSNKREYAFWAGITSDFPIDIVGKDFKLEDTYQDDFKLDVVAKLIRGVLIPQIRNDFRDHISILDLPTSWRGNKYEYFMKYFQRENRFYVDHLITSVSGIIDDSKNIDRDYYHRIYKDLRNRVKQEIDSAIKEFLS
jgi:hypothetical protein